MPGDLAVLLGDQRQTVLRGDHVPQAADKPGHDGTMVTECPEVNLPHVLSVTRKFLTKIHARRVGTPPGGSHSVLASRVSASWSSAA
ncbi:hypothetical protein GCM10010510_19890 [Streptomyces anandii JCM 4720]|nr:hypothetical protein GCM10010510_19890 [Streptomyces anandii JCM 4720]